MRWVIIMAVVATALITTRVELVQRIRSMIPGINLGVSYGDGSDPSIHFFDHDAYHNSFVLCEVLKHFLLEGKTSNLRRFLQGPSCNAKSRHSVDILFRMSLLLRADTTKSKLSAVVPPQRIFMGRSIGCQETVPAGMSTK